MSEQTNLSRVEERLLQTHGWLRGRNLTRSTLPIDFWDPKTGIREFDPAQMVMTLPTKRAQQHKKRDLESLTKEWCDASKAVGGLEGRAPSPASLDALLDRNPNLFADMRRLPANAIAFYRPFHLEPFEHWGIYIFVAGQSLERGG